ncbi:hypothetical protein [Candidatus Mesenet endosymbiont of Phosphuga atrata]|uniref:hypothetical protein n=1 Tax=Candidatus Mesenet endosymbiont of Phosphuga atrata TaxID=3066221 RepID=UPI0030D41B2C
MFSCFTKCCAKKNSITNHPVKKVSDNTVREILLELAHYRDPERYKAFPKILEDLKRLEQLEKPINNDCTLYVSSV